MRSIVGIFGALCGIIVVALVARYGFKSSDNDIDGYINAFLFGTIAIGGLGGHAVAVRLWRMNRLWSAIIWMVCAVALIVNLSNSLGAIAGRGDATHALREKQSQSITDARAELDRLVSQRDAIPAFQPTDDATVAAARRAADAASQAREAECKKRGDKCRDREADERARTSELAKAASAKATTDRAASLDKDIKALRLTLETAGPAQSLNPQGAAIARLFRLPDSEADRASTYQQFAIAVIVELLIVGAFIAFELLSRERVIRLMPIKEATQLRVEERASIETKALPIPQRIEPERISAPPAPKPRLVSSDTTPAGSVPELVAEALEPAIGSRVEIEDVYRAYAVACKGVSRRAVKPEHFIDPLKKFCRSCKIKTAAEGDNIYLLDVQLKIAVTNSGYAS